MRPARVLNLMTCFLGEFLVILIDSCFLKTHLRTSAVIAQSCAFYSVKVWQILKTFFFSCRKSSSIIQCVFCNTRQAVNYYLLAGQDQDQVWRYFFDFLCLRSYAIISRICRSRPTAGERSDSDVLQTLVTGQIIFADLRLRSFHGSR